jgi:hypothetical protein
MTQAEVEAELTNLRAQVSQLTSLEAARSKRWRPIIKASQFIAILFGIVTIVLAAISAWTHDSNIMPFAFPWLAAAIPLNLSSATLRE